MLLRPVARMGLKVDYGTVSIDISKMRYTDSAAWYCKMARSELRILL